MNYLERAIREVKRWNVSMTPFRFPVGIKKTESFSSGPITGGIFYPSGLIYWPVTPLGEPNKNPSYTISTELKISKVREPELGELACSLIHELAHVIVRKNPGKVLETGAMLAVEQEANFRLKLPWVQWMSHYGIDDDDNLWGKATKYEKSLVLKAARFEAQKLNLFDSNNKPTYKKVTPIGVRN